MRNRFRPVFSQDKGGACEHGHREKILDVYPFMAVPNRAKPKKRHGMGIKPGTKRNMGGLQDFNL